MQRQKQWSCEEEDEEQQEVIRREMSRQRRRKSHILISSFKFRSDAETKAVEL